MQGDQGSIEQGQVGRDNVVASGPRVASNAPTRAGAGTVWAGSAFDLAQGLEITVFETRMSIEDLDEMFR